MVVLEEGGMLTSGHNQYLQPDYLSPLPTTLDAKKSPLALLAQTCSQIGADSPTKPMISPLEKPSKGSGMAGSNARSPPTIKVDRTRGSPQETKPLGFKPYETNVVTKKSSSDDVRPGSKTSVHSLSAHENSASGVGAGGGVCDNIMMNNNNNNHHNNNNNNINNNNMEKKSSSSFSSSSSCGSGTPVGRKSASPTVTGGGNDRKTPGDHRDKTNSSPHGHNHSHNHNHNHNHNHSTGASPIIRSGMEILSGHQKDTNSLGAYKHASFANGPLCCPPGIAENPAFRPPFAGASPFSHHHAAAAALLGYPSPSPSTGGSPYLSYARVKTPSGGEALVPVCKDPYCTGCQYSMHNAQMMMGAGSCPSGCSQCDHQKYGLAMALSSLGPMPPPPSLSYQSSLAAAAAAGGGRPFVCNWTVGESYCGKRFSTADDLLQHLRSHTNLVGGNDPASAAVAAGLMNGPPPPPPHTHPLLSPSAALHRAAAAAAAAYPAPSLSPLSARYHPYGKPPAGPLPASLAASPYSAFNALGPYYSPYAIYGQRIGAAVHQ